MTPEQIEYAIKCLENLRIISGYRYKKDFANDLKIRLSRYTDYCKGTPISNVDVNKIVKFSKGKIKYSDLRPDLKDKSFKSPRTKNNFLVEELDFVQKLLGCKTQKELARKLGIHRVTLNYWRSGYRGISIKYAHKIESLCNEKIQLKDLYPNTLIYPLTSIKTKMPEKS